MISLGVGNRALPLVWTVEAGPAHLGFEAQKVLLERVRAWLPAGAEVLLSADRCFPPWSCSAGSTPNPAGMIGYG